MCHSLECQCLYCKNEIIQIRDRLRYHENLNYQARKWRQVLPYLYVPSQGGEFVTLIICIYFYPSATQGSVKSKR